MDAKQDVWRAIPALMGDGNGVIEVPNQPGYVYIRIGDGDKGQAFNNRCPLRDNLAIYVGYDPVTDPERRIFQVLSVRMSDYANAGNAPIANVPPHHTYHEFGGGDDVYIDWRRLLGFRVGRPTGFTVTVDQGVMMRAGAWTAITSQTVNLAASQPGGINNARYVLVALDSAGVITTSNGAIVSAAALTISNCPAPAAGSIPLAAVRLYTTQTQISDVPGTPDIVDLRFPQVYATGGSNVFGSGTANQFAYWAAADTLTGSAQVTRSADTCLIATKAATTLAPGTYTFGIFSDVTITAALAQSGQLHAYGSHVHTGGAVNYTGELTGYETLLYHSGTGTASAMYGVVSIIDSTSTGTISDAAVLFGGLTAGATGVITTGYGVHIDAPIGSIGTYYGTYIETCAAATTKWAFYAEGDKITTKLAAAAGIELDTNAATGNFTMSLSPANLTGNRRVTFGDVTGIAALGAGTLTNATANDITVANHTHAITGAFTPTAHAIDGAEHTVAGRTIGQVLIATAAATFGWSAFKLTSIFDGTLNLEIGSTKTLTLTCLDDASIEISGIHHITGGGALSYLTLPNAITVITGGGTLALGTFTLTVPATGTAALGTGTATRLAVWSNANTLAAGNVVQPAANVLTLLNSAASTLSLAITAAKTLTLTAADDYNLTIPATGTVALLGTANVFTANQTISSAAPSLILTDTTGGAKSLTVAVDANLANLRESAGAAGSLLVLDLANDRVGIGTTTLDNYGVRISKSFTATAAAYGAILGVEGTITSAAGQNTWAQILLPTMTLVGPTGANVAGAFYLGPTLTKPAVGETIGIYTGAYFQVPATTGAGTGTVTEADTVRIQGPPTIGSTNWSLNIHTGNARVGGDTYLIGKFGCNNVAPQSPLPSGGDITPGAGAFGASSAVNFAAMVTLVKNIRTALVANGIMS